MKLSDEQDEIVRAAFEHLRASDVREQPSFAATLAGRASQRLRFRYSVTRVMAAAAIVIAIAATYRELSLRRERLTVSDEISALIAWQPASDDLLPSPASLMGRGELLSRSTIEFNLPTRVPPL